MLRTTARRTRRVTLVGVVALAAIVGATACSSKSSSESKGGNSKGGVHATVNLELFGVPSAQVAPMVYGVAAGIYKKYGLDVKIKYQGSNTQDPNQLVNAGRADFGVGSAANLLSLQSKGGGLKAVMGYFQSAGNGVIYRTDEGITKPADLSGHTVGIISGEAADRALFEAFLSKFNVPVDSVHMQQQSVPAINALYVSKKIDAAIKFADVVKPTYKAAGIDSAAFTFGDYLQWLGYVVMTKSSYATSHPDVVRAFDQATAEAIAGSIKNPKAAAQAVYNSAPSTSPKVAVVTEQMEILNYVSSKADCGHPLGWMDSGDWQSTLKILSKTEDLGNLKASSVYTNDYITKNPTVTKTGQPQVACTQ